MHTILLQQNTIYYHSFKYVYISQKRDYVVYYTIVSAGSLILLINICIYKTTGSKNCQQMK